MFGLWMGSGHRGGKAIWASYQLCSGSSRSARSSTHRCSTARIAIWSQTSTGRLFIAGEDLDLLASPRSLVRCRVHPRRQSELEWSGEADRPIALRLAVCASRRRSPLVHPDPRARWQDSHPSRRSEVLGIRRVFRPAAGGSSADRLGLPAGFPSGQRGLTVNQMATPSQVRILVPPYRPSATPTDHSIVAGRAPRVLRLPAAT